MLRMSKRIHVSINGELASAGVDSSARLLHARAVGESVIALTVETVCDDSGREIIMSPLITRINSDEKPFDPETESIYATVVTGAGYTYHVMKVDKLPLAE